MQPSLFKNPENMLPSNGEAILYPQFFAVGESDDYLAQLTNRINWKQEPIKMFGKQIMQPRLTALYGDVEKKYSYSGITMQPMQWIEPLLKIKEQIEPIAAVHFTTALLNFYRNGSDSMGWHRDNEKELGRNPVIGSVSFGVARKFQFRNYTDKKQVKNIELTHGSFLLMQGETQHHWEHQLPKTSQTILPRINITFRVIV